MKNVLKKIALSVLQNVKNVPGWSTKRKILVIESDDWGSIRLPSRAVYENFKEKGFRVEHSQYNRYDALESSEDLEQLMTVLSSVTNGGGKPVKFTANAILANPDFEKIRESNFQEYTYEPFTATVARKKDGAQVMSLWHQGIAAKILHPQFHGREHVNIARWLRALQSGDQNTVYCFSQGTTYSGNDDYNFMETLDMDAPSEIDTLKTSLTEGLSMFNDIFGFHSKSFIAPCYTWDSKLEPTLVAAGVQYLQGGIFQYVPKGGFNNYDRKYRIIGRKTEAGLTNLVRNCAFEPSLVKRNDWIEYALAGVETAFRWGKPAIMCAHRLNFIGSIDERNRTENLRMFKQLLQEIVKRWPEVEFMSSDELGDLINKQ